MNKSIFSSFAIAIISALLLFSSSQPAMADWSTNISKNNQVTPTDVGFYDQEVLTTSDGYTYCYFIVPAANLVYRLQIVDPNGNLVCRSAGLSVSNKVSNSWTKVNHPVALDNDGNLIMAVQDMRTRNDSLNQTYLYTLYKINRKGEIVWEHSLNDSISSYDSSYITLAVAPDNSIYAAFGEIGVGYKTSYLNIEKMDENGKNLWKEPLIIKGENSNNYSYPTIKALPDNNAIVGFINTTNSHFQVLKVNSDATLAWDAPKDIYTGTYGSTYVWQSFEMRQLDDTTFAFETITGDKTSAVVCFDAEGNNLTFGQEYASLTTVEDYGISLDDFCYDAKDKVLNTAYRQIDLSNTNHHGIFVQQLGTDGSRYFDDEGDPVIAMQEDDQYGYTKVRQTDKDKEFAVFFIKKDGTSYTSAAQCYMCKMNYDAEMTMDPVAITSSDRSKSDMEVSNLITSPEGSYYLVSWLEKRGITSNPSVYMQRVFVNGVVGTDTSEVHIDGKEAAVTTVAPGTLPTLIPANQKYGISKLSLSGPINGTDIAYLRDMMGLDSKNAETEGQLAELDLSGATIKAGGKSYLTDLIKDIDFYVTKDYKIPSQAFSKLPQLTSIVLPANAIEIGDSAFYYTKSLTNITFPEKLTSIGSYAFDYTALTEVTVPSTCLSIGRSAFREVSTLTSLTLPDALTEIPSGLASFTGLTNINWPKSCTKIGEGAFSYCTSLTEVAIPEGVTEIEDNAFSGVKTLTTVTFPSTLVTIGEGAFNYCPALLEANLPEGVKNIGAGAFYSCSKLVSATLPESLTAIPERLFGNDYSFSSVNIPAGLVSIGDQAFNNCFEMTSFEFPESVTSIGNSAFESVPLEGKLVLPEGLTKLGKNAFAYTNITSFNLPKAITKIPDECFESCNYLTKVNIPEGVTAIGTMAFGTCVSLESVTLPSTLTSVGFYSFSYCEKCTSVKSYAKTPGVVATQFSQRQAFNGMASDCVLYVPEGCKDAYAGSAPWNVFASIEEFTPTVTGDVTGDNKVDISDVNAVIEVICGGAQNDNADVNGDGKVDISDVNAVIAIICAN